MKSALLAVDLRVYSVAHGTLVCRLLDFMLSIRIIMDRSRFFYLKRIWPECSRAVFVCVELRSFWLLDQKLSIFDFCDWLKLWSTNRWLSACHFLETRTSCWSTMRMINSRMNFSFLSLNWRCSMITSFRTFSSLTWGWVRNDMWVENACLYIWVLWLMVSVWIRWFDILNQLSVTFQVYLFRIRPLMSALLSHFHYFLFAGCSGLMFATFLLWFAYDIWCTCGSLDIKYIISVIVSWLNGIQHVDGFLNEILRSHEARIPCVH